MGRREGLEWGGSRGVEKQREQENTEEAKGRGGNKWGWVDTREIPFSLTTEADHTVRTTPSTTTAVPPYMSSVTSFPSTSLPKSTFVTNFRFQKKIFGDKKIRREKR